MHQVIWAKLLVGVIGATAHAQATVLAVFMGGLAIGAVTIGRRIDRRGRPLRTYVVLEFAIAAYGLALPLLVTAAGAGYVAIATLVFESAGQKLLLRFVLAALVVLVPAVLMGGTLPALARHAITGLADTRRQVGRLYSLNSVGAVLGAGVAGFLALPSLGVHGSLFLACGLNGLAGLLLWRPARLEAALATPPTGGPPTARSPVAEPYSRVQYTTALIALALSGFAAMAYEVLFTRIIALAFGASTYSFSVMLMSFITGIAIGSALIARRISFEPCTQPDGGARAAGGEPGRARRPAPRPRSDWALGRRALLRERNGLDRFHQPGAEPPRAPIGPGRLGFEVEPPCGELSRLARPIRSRLRVGRV